MSEWNSFVRVYGRNGMKAYRATDKMRRPKKKTPPKAARPWSAELAKRLARREGFSVNVGPTTVIRWLWDDDIDRWDTKILNKKGKLVYSSLSGNHADVLAKVLTKASAMGVRGAVTFVP